MKSDENTMFKFGRLLGGINNKIFSKENKHAARSTIMKGMFEAGKKTAQVKDALLKSTSN